jgi:hypothetical protein
MISSLINLGKEIDKEDIRLTFGINFDSECAQLLISATKDLKIIPFDFVSINIAFEPSIYADGQ